MTETVLLFIGGIVGAIIAIIPALIMSRQIKHTVDNLDVDTMQKLQTVAKNAVADLVEVKSRLDDLEKRVDNQQYEVKVTFLHDIKQNTVKVIDTTVRIVPSMDSIQIIE